jgi:hypothetical protein
MAQYIPKTAWKVNNLAKRYGAGFVGLHNQRTPVSPPGFFASTTQPNTFMFDSEGYNSKMYDAQQLQSRVASAMQVAAGRRATSSSSFIDLRDETERQMLPLPFAVSLHHHDLLSGACQPLLPTDTSVEIFVIASARQRAVNGFNALRRWGYHNVVVADAASLARFSTPSVIPAEEGKEEENVEQQTTVADGGNQKQTGEALASAS